MMEKVDIQRDKDEMKEGVKALGQSFPWMGITYAFVFIFCYTPPLWARRLVFLVSLRAQWDPTYLARDWFFSAPNSNHLVFNVVFGFWTRWVSVETLYLIGSLTSWAVIIRALFRLGFRLGVGPMGSALAIVSWLIARQSVVAHEYILGGLEAKLVAYALLLPALEAVLDKRWKRGALLVGLSFSFHPAVGMWGGLATGAAFAWDRRSLSPILLFGVIALLASFPGMYPLLRDVFSKTESTADARFLATVLFPMHLDPRTWPARDHLTLWLLFAFNILHAYARKDDRALRFFAVFQSTLALAFVLGLIARRLEIWGFIRFMPFRLFPVFALLLFFFQVMRAAHECLAAAHEKRPLFQAMALSAFLALSALPNLPASGMDHARLNMATWTRSPDDLQKLFSWVRTHLPTDAIVIAPPWRQDAPYLMERAQVATFEIYAHDRPREWRSRVELLLGTDWSGLTTSDWTRRKTALSKAYDRLDDDRIQEARDRYGAGYLISRRDHPYDEVHREGAWRIYALPPPARPEHGGDAAHRHEGHLREGTSER